MPIGERLRTFRGELTGDFVAGIEAERFAGLMVEQHPKEWAEWCQAVAVDHVRTELIHQERQERRRALRPSRLFALAAENNDYGTLGLFRVTFRVDAANTRRPFGQMTADDCRYAAEGYRQASAQARMMASFLMVVADRVKQRRTVEQVLTEEQVRRMLISLGGNGDELLAA